MTSEKRQNPRRFTPSIDRVYENAGGGFYRCELPVKPEPCTAWMQNTASGWMLLAHGIVRYADGTIEWNYSTGGHFEKLPEARAEIRSRQFSLANAMLCLI